MAGCNVVSTPPDVPDAAPGRIERVEPPSWWTGMQTPLQILVKGEKISAYNVSIAGGKGVRVKSVTPGDSPDYVFVDVTVSASASPGTYWLIFETREESFKISYEIGARSREPRKSFSSEDRPVCERGPCQ